MAGATGYEAHSLAADAAGGTRAAAAAPPSSVHHPDRVKQRAAAAVELFDKLAKAPWEFDFFQVLRRLECAHRDRPRLGEAARPAEEPIRLGQEASLTFAPASLAGLRPGKNGAPPWLLVHFLGLLGPNGALPLHLTEYARDRLRNSDDPTMVRFLDLFNHRMLLFFYRAWANGEPTVNRDRPESDPFGGYIGSLAGLAARTLQNRDDFPDAAKLYYAGLLGSQSKHPGGLASIIGDFFAMPSRIEEFVGGWLELPIDGRWALGRRTRLLGMATTLGAHAWSCQQKFRVVLGPLNRDQFRRMLPGGESLKRLVSVVRNYIGDELRWDVRLYLEERVEEPLHLGRSYLSWTSWLGRAAPARREDLILDPQAETVATANVVI
jgi:type VI secretion system protein ImpH